jgi:ABC-2 type transport system permease protein
MGRKLAILLWRDWLNARSYRMAFLLQMFAGAAPLVILVFMSRLFANTNIEGISRYGGDYVPFIMLGTVVATYSLTALRAFSTGLRQAQTTGTLEVLLLTRASPYTVMFGWALYPFARAGIHMLVYLSGAFLLLGLHIDNANFFAAFASFVLTIGAMTGLGLIAASFTLVFKQGDPFTAVVTMAAVLVSGMLYPVDVLPSWLRWLSVTIPQTHSMEAMRLALLQGYSVLELAVPLGALALFTVVLVPIALLAFRLALYRARVVGSLAHY